MTAFERGVNNGKSQSSDGEFPSLAAVGVGKRYRLTRGVGGYLDAVKDVSIELHQGRVLAVVGESGSGKSTLAKLLAGREIPSAGHVELAGSAITVKSKRRFKEYKRVVQMIFQDPFASLNPVHTIRYHLERPIKIHQHLHGQELQAQLDDLMEQVRLTPSSRYLSKYPHELSGGQRQRVSIARALAAKPMVLLADEPVSMLDVSIRLEILALLDDLRSRLGLAVLYITHDIASARYLADEIVVMYAGQVVERGTAEEVTQIPSHPYTQLLIRSSPDPDSIAVNRSQQLNILTPTSSGARTNIGCPFAVRCPLVTDICMESYPPTTEVGGAHFANCCNLEIKTTQSDRASVTHFGIHEGGTVEI